MFSKNYDKGLVLLLLAPTNENEFYGNHNFLGVTTLLSFCAQTLLGSPQM